MCFSATASFLAAGGLTAAGAITLREAKAKSSWPIAGMPLLFGVQQAIEGVIWLTPDMPLINNAAAYAYVMFSHVLWPTYVPYAVMLLEPPGRRRNALKWFLLLGVSLSLWLLSHIMTGPVTATCTTHSIIYNLTVPPIPYALAACYVIATCVSCLVSSHKFIRVFGLALLGSLCIALMSYFQAFYSVWCFFAAILSFIIYVHLHQGRHAELRGKKH